MGAGRLLDLLLCRQSFLEMILAGAVVELRPRPITDERKERELGQERHQLTYIKLKRDSSVRWFFLTIPIYLG
jgi:hypothetical protein